MKTPKTQESPWTALWTLNSRIKRSTTRAPSWIFYTVDWITADKIRVRWSITHNSTNKQYRMIVTLLSRSKISWYFSFLFYIHDHFFLINLESQINFVWACSHLMTSRCHRQQCLYFFSLFPNCYFWTCWMLWLN